MDRHVQSEADFTAFVAARFERVLERADVKLIKSTFNVASVALRVTSSAANTDRLWLKHPDLGIYFERTIGSRSTFHKSKHIWSHVDLPHSSGRHRFTKRPSSTGSSIVRTDLQLQFPDRQSIGCSSSIPEFVANQFKFIQRFDCRSACVHNSFAARFHRRVDTHHILFHLDEPSATISIIVFSISISVGSGSRSFVTSRISSCTSQK
jgi:hypothetical protein